MQLAGLNKDGGSCILNCVRELKMEVRPQMTSRAIAYWAATALVAAELAVGGVWDVLRIPAVRGVITHLGYPSYFLVILGVWKLAGATAVLVPRFPRVKEWAYAGAFFNCTGGIASHLVVGDGLNFEVAYLIVLTGLLIASWALRPPSRRLPAN